VAIGAPAWAAAPDDAVAAAEALGYPLVVKPAREGCSTGLAVVDDALGLRAAIAAALEWDRTALVEERLEGTEVTVAVLDGDPPTAYPPTETPPQDLFLTIEEKFLPGHGKNITPARLPAETIAAVRAAAVRAFGALGLAVFARMDMYVTTDGRIVIGEPNTLPGSTPSSTIFLGPIEEGIGPQALVTQVVEMSLAAHRAKRGPLG
jgi:D-alanine-D-alanine ligase